MRSLALRLHGTVRATLLAAMLTVTLGSCEEGISPDARVMVYVLQSIDGDAPPVRPYATSNHVVLADSLIFNADGTGTERMVTRWDDDATVRTTDVSFTWSSGGSRLDMWTWCPGNGIAACPSGPTLGGITAGGLWHVTASYRYPTPTVFRRVD